MVVLRLPKGALPTGMQLVLEDHVAQDGAGPFIANFVMACRIDVPQGTALETVVETDRAGIEQQGNMHLTGAGTLPLEKGAASTLEWEQRDGDRTVQQVMYFFRAGMHLFTAVGAHLPGKPFLAVRPKFDALVQDFAKGVSENVR